MPEVAVMCKLSTDTSFYKLSLLLIPPWYLYVRCSDNNAFKKNEIICLWRPLILINQALSPPTPTGKWDFTRDKRKNEIHHWSQAQWLTPVIPATQEAKTRRIKVRSQPREIVLETLSRKIPSQKMTGGVAQGEGPEFKPQYRKKKKFTV
jgi:hypothetical protein